MYCSALQSINIPNTVTKIGNSAFSRCDSLLCIEIPNSVKEIERYAFNSDSLQKIIIDIENTDTIIVEGDVVDDPVYDRCVLYVPSGTRWAYRHHPILGKFKNIEIIKNR